MLSANFRANFVLGIFNFPKFSKEFFGSKLFGVFCALNMQHFRRKYDDIIQFELQRAPRVGLATQATCNFVASHFMRQ